MNPHVGLLQKVEYTQGRQTMNVPRVILTKFFLLVFSFIIHFSFKLTFPKAGENLLSNLPDLLKESNISPYTLQ